MKTETEIAKENVANIRIDIPEERALYPKQIQHKQTCQRFLIKIQTDLEWANTFYNAIFPLEDFPDFLKASIEGFMDDKEEEEKDKEQAIKIYSENGI